MYKKYESFSAGLFTGIVEIWSDLKDWEDCYSVSSFGQIKSKDKVRVKERQGKVVNAFYKGRTMIPKFKSCGYMGIHLRDAERNSHLTVHRVVALTFIENQENKPTVNHKDGNKQNNKISNLEWSTHSEQTVHAVNTGLIKPRGTPVYSPDFKKEVYDYFMEKGCSLKHISKHFSISKKTAADIAAGKISRQGLKIKEEHLAEIISLRSQGWTLKSISDRFDCGISQIHRITNGKSRNVVYERNSTSG